MVASSCWLSTVSGAGRVHTVAIGAFFVDETYYFTSGQGTRKRANLAQNPSCTLCIHAGDYDIVAEGTAAITRDVPYHAPTTGPAPYDVYEMTLRKVFAHGTTDKAVNHCTRYIF